MSLKIKGICILSQQNSQPERIIFKQAICLQMLHKFANFRRLIPFIFIYLFVFFRDCCLTVSYLVQTLSFFLSDKLIFIPSWISTITMSPCNDYEGCWKVAHFTKSDQIISHQNLLWNSVLVSLRSFQHLLISKYFESESHYSNWSCLL